jgi:hypothetical protein
LFFFFTFFCILPPSRYMFFWFRSRRNRCQKLLRQHFHVPVPSIPIVSGKDLVSGWLLTCFKKKKKKKEQELRQKHTSKALDRCMSRYITYPLMHQEGWTCHNQKDPLWREAPRVGHDPLDPEGSVSCHFFRWKQSRTDPPMSGKHHPPTESEPSTS